MFWYECGSTKDWQKFDKPSPYSTQRHPLLFLRTLLRKSHILHDEFGESKLSEGEQHEPRPQISLLGVAKAGVCQLRVIFRNLNVCSRSKRLT